MEESRDFETQALPHLTALFRVAVAMCGNMVLAEDLVQTTMTKALGSFALFREGSNCKAWLVKILRNTWVDYLRHKKVAGPQITIEEQIVPEKQHPEVTHWSNPTDLLDNFSDQRVIEALMQLPDDQRLTLYLTDVEQLNQDDVAEILQVALGTVKSRTSRARAALRTKLNDYAIEMGFADGGRR
ncbi:MAG TPA: sigma-70 family RNA polymerase sigma factor [Phycisphaerae bacterium]|nr:sigma-70 family RNA polymerase sigma factor [Phycisphaerae bacterium]